MYVWRILLKIDVNGGLTFIIRNTACSCLEISITKPMKIYIVSPLMLYEVDSILCFFFCSSRFFFLSKNWCYLFGRIRIARSLCATGVFFSVSPMCSDCRLCVAVPGWKLMCLFSTNIFTISSYSLCFTMMMMIINLFNRFRWCLWIKC